MKALLCVVFGGALALVFPPVDWGWYAFVGLIPLPLITRGEGLCKGFFLGLFFGYAHFVAALYWLAEVHFMVPWGLAIYCALWPALWITLYNGFVKRIAHKWLQILFGAVLWVSCEWLRGHLFTGFPWDFLGVSQWQYSTVTLVRWTGVYGLSFLIVLTNLTIFTCLPYLLQRKKSGRKRVLILATAPLLIWLVVCICAWSSFSMPVTTGEHLNLATCQGNMSLRRIYTPELLIEARDTYLELADLAAKDKTLDLIVWPETPVPAPLFWERDYCLKFAEMLQRNQKPVLMGTVDYRSISDSETQLSFNSAMYFPKNSVRWNAHAKANVPVPEAIYDKTHPVPFGEYLPLGIGEIFPDIQKMIGRNLTAGTEFTVFNLPKGVKAGVNICYEDAFPGIGRNFVRNGANFLITITNDAWYVKSAGSRQHFSNSVFRAVENGTYMLRSGNRSYSTVIGPDGSIMDAFDRADKAYPFLKGVGRYKVPIIKDYKPTFYAMYGDLFVYLCLVASVIGIYFQFIRFLAEKKKWREAIAPRSSLNV